MTNYLIRAASVASILFLFSCEKPTKQVEKAMGAISKPAENVRQPDPLPAATAPDTTSFVTLPEPPKLSSPTSRKSAWPGVITLSDTVLPARINQPGQVVEMKKWSDQDGEKLLVITRTKPTNDYKPGDKTDEGYIVEEGDIHMYSQTSYLHIRQYIRDTLGYKEMWRIQDVMSKCFQDMWIGTYPNATSITDLDGDQHTETTVVYQLSCRSDASAAMVKLIMREGNAKYALRGYSLLPTTRSRENGVERRLCCIDTIYQGKSTRLIQGISTDKEGLYQNENDFAQAPPAFLRFAREEWRYWRTADNFQH